ncbi:DUF6381 family protein [Actinacidiphila acidipaludis]|uniref:DUF6381 family protein n=1 Tax=Actinacidiphila acidipaludis TaxID=2873382 RepID=A0ABS7QEA2_9ACTN|nr:DUF6381 family protein [Streptomyces acidipaludis]MBY8881457.1 DUF6381 family protein [Streptomyces acidipaludis]
MNATGDAHRHLQEMRDKARELEAEAERSQDPEERRRLQERVRQLELDSEQESMMAAGDIYPTE